MYTYMCTPWLNHQSLGISLEHSPSIFRLENTPLRSLMVSALQKNSDENMDVPGMKTWSKRWSCTIKVSWCFFRSWVMVKIHSGDLLDTSPESPADARDGEPFQSSITPQGTGTRKLLNKGLMWKPIGDKRISCKTVWWLLKPSWKIIVSCDSWDDDIPKIWKFINAMFETTNQ